MGCARFGAATGAVRVGSLCVCRKNGVLRAVNRPPPLMASYVGLLRRCSYLERYILERGAADASLLPFLSFVQVGHLDSL